VNWEFYGEVGKTGKAGGPNVCWRLRLKACASALHLQGTSPTPGHRLGRGSAHS